MNSFFFKFSCSAQSFRLGLVFLCCASPLLAESARAECPSKKIKPTITCQLVTEESKGGHQVLCELGPCMGDLPPLNEKAVYVQTAENQRVAGALEVNKKELRWTPNRPFLPGIQYEIVWKQKGLKNSERQGITILGATKVKGTWHFPFEVK